MCRIFGIVAAEARPIAPWLTDAEPSLRSLAIADQSGEANADGWGIGWYEGEQNTPRVVKEPVPANESALYEQTAHSVSARIALAHVRRSSGSPRVLANTHPFASGPWLFCHNGYCPGEQLKELLEPDFKDSLLGANDSEVYFAFLRQQLHASTDPVEALRRGVQEVIALGDFSGLNFLLSDGRSMYAFHYSTDPERHGMYLQHQQNMQLVASEPLGDGAWEWLSNGSMAELTPGGCTITSLV
jgi:glutamine amidotransferase